MVDFTQTAPNFYIKDPRVVTQQVSAFFNDNYGVPVATGGSPYNPTAFTPQNSALGIVSATVSRISNAVVGVAGVGAADTGTVAVVPGVDVVDTGQTTTTAPETSATSPVFDASGNRLQANNLPPGADYANAPTATSQAAPGTMSAGQESDTRVMIKDPTGKFSQGGILAPLAATGGVLFPYTPQIGFSHKANYDTEQLMHANYEMPHYKNSSVEAITLAAPFTANDPEEALYVMAVIHFFRSVTKMFYGQDAIAGTPPPVLFLEGYGAFVMDSVPVVVTSFDFQLPQDVDYISINGETGGTPDALIPTALNINLTMKPVYSRNRISSGFGLEQFAQGALIINNTSGSMPPAGGFI